MKGRRLHPVPSQGARCRVLRGATRGGTFWGVQMWGNGVPELRSGRDISCGVQRGTPCPEAGAPAREGALTQFAPIPTWRLTGSRAGLGGRGVCGVCLAWALGGAWWGVRPLRAGLSVLRATGKQRAGMGSPHRHATQMPPCPCPRPRGYVGHGHAARGAPPASDPAPPNPSRLPPARGAERTPLPQPVTQPGLPARRRCTRPKEGPTGGTQGLQDRTSRGWAPPLPPSCHSRTHPGWLSSENPLPGTPGGLQKRVERAWVTGS